MITGPDISSHQHDAGVPLDFHAVKAAGHSFVIVKATQDTGYTNPFFVQDVRDAQAAGLIAMPYHYMGPDAAAAQVGALLSIVRQCFTSGMLWLDYEEHTDHAVLHEMERELDATAFRPGVYTYPDWWANNGDPTCQLCSRHPLWWANYSPPYTLGAPAPWSQVALRQTHGTAYAVPGIPGMNDMSRAEVDLATLTGIKIPIPTLTEDPDMARLISEDGKAIWGTDGVRVYHVPNPTVLASLKASGVYGDGKVTAVPAGTIASLEAAEK